MNLAEMRAERDRLVAEIAAAEKQERENWNEALSVCEDGLASWLRGHGIEVTASERKNETVLDVGHGALTVAFGFAEANYGHWLRMTSGQTLTLEWSEVPAPARLLDIAAVLLNRWPLAPDPAEPEVDWLALLGYVREWDGSKSREDDKRFLAVLDLFKKWLAARGVQVS
jgi:hypothetical protein